MSLPRIEYLPGVVLPVIRGERHACPYLPGRTAAEYYALPLEIDERIYEHLMVRGFRRSGGLFYRAACPDCDACEPIRVPVTRFEPSRSQRRVRRRNADVTVDIGPPISDDERWELFGRYQREQHGGEMLGTRGEFEEFLCGSPIPSIEMTFRVGRRLVGIGVVDVCPDSLSSVYFYFDPCEARRSLGVFSALCEIDECRRRGLEHWYLGYYINGCRKMDYKNHYRPHELRGTDGVWREAAHD